MDLDPDWVAAVGQVVGAGATVWAVLAALRIAGRDRRRYEEDRVDEARGRAAMVFAKDDGGNVVVTNHSDRVVRDVAVRVGHPSEMPLHWSPNNPAGYVTDLLPSGTTAILRSTYELVSASGDTRYPLNGAPAESWIVLHFVDTEGRRWLRVANEPPQWQRPAPPPGRVRRLFTALGRRYRAWRGGDDG